MCELCTFAKVQGNSRNRRHQRLTLGICDVLSQTCTAWRVPMDEPAFGLLQFASAREVFFR